ncbi:hypothetical protein AK812_SmicGene12383 [Symbiodinium microadriaticum]|uniref:Uncharacterized protein n=1 Tax=Symbiodinium microadriaticum TaxID=2951 RepID=A0A1Q9EAT2_SYMMI|nr:hypothetical protein AK812_SmicGene12383 [Symbiodinium microadriaticum]
MFICFTECASKVYTYEGICTRGTRGLKNARQTEKADLLCAAQALSEGVTMAAVPMDLEVESEEVESTLLQLLMPSR